MSTGGNQFGSAAQSNPMRSYGQPSPMYSSPAYGQAQSYFSNRMGMMPGFQRRQNPGAFGGMGNPQVAPQEPPVGDSGLHPHTPQGSQPDRAIASPASAFGIGQTFQQDRDVASPASAFGIRPYENPQPEASYVGQAMTQPAQPQNNMMNTPWGQQALASLGPSFNAVGSPQGGYFQNNKWTPNVGNARNGLDVLNRFGMNWDGSALNPGLGIR